MVADGRPFEQLLRESSAEADLVMMRDAAPDSVPDFAAYYAALHRRVGGLPTTVFVLAAEEPGVRRGPDRQPMTAG